MDCITVQFIEQTSVMSNGTSGGQKQVHDKVLSLLIPTSGDSVTLRRILYRFYIVRTRHHKLLLPF